MITNFKVENCLSFKEMSTLDMQAEGLKEKKGFIHIPYLHNSKLQILKSAVIIGFNAFGKSNFLKAYDLYRNFVLQSFLRRGVKPLRIEPFALNTETIDKPSTLESEFILKGTKYKYGFSVLKDIIVGEWLYYADGPVRWNSLFIRAGQEYKEISKLWNKETRNKIDQAKFFTRPENLFLSVLLSQDDIPRIQEIRSWFEGNIILRDEYARITNSEAIKIYSREENRNAILKFLDNGDLGFKSVFERIATTKQLGWEPTLVDDVFEKAQNNFDLFTQHEVFNAEYKLQKLVEFELAKNESSGSIKYFIISCYLAQAIRNAQLIWIDEIDATLHPQLLMFLIQTFTSDKNNTTGAQLIFTSHNTIILDNKLRRDQIWFVDKNEFGESTLMKGHTTDEPIRINKSIEGEYRSGKIKKGNSRKLNSTNLPSLFDSLD